ncbi:MAG: ABC transporter ATP-binding protein [Gammaproteobacteria bacterium]
MIHEPALKVENLSFSYGKKKALDNVGFSVRHGECCILLGPNGAGKSTLFSLITRLYDTRIGSINLAGFDVKKQTRRALERLGVVFQQTTLDLDLSVMQNLRYHAALHGIDSGVANRRIRVELERLGMYERRKEKIRQLNGGHRRRVEIARALLHEPSVLLLDELTVGLDVPTRQTIVEHIHRLTREQNIAVLWATHLIDEIYPTDKIVILDHGKVLANGSLEEIVSAAAAKDVKEAFNILTGMEGERS